MLAGSLRPRLVVSLAAPLNSPMFARQPSQKARGFFLRTTSGAYRARSVHHPVGLELSHVDLITPDTSAWAEIYAGGEL